MKLLDMESVIQQDYRQHQLTNDSLLLLMNGIAIAGTLDKLPNFLASVKHC